MMVKSIEGWQQGETERVLLLKLLIFFLFLTL